MNDGAEFLRAYLKGVPDPAGLYFYLWSLETKRSTPFGLAEADVVDRATAWNEPPLNTYVGASLTSRPLSPYQRVTKHTAAGIVGCWLDIDVAGPGHQKANLPRTMDEACELLTDFDLPPTALISSGHGLQAWWLFHEALIFENEDDHQAGTIIAKRWVDYSRGIAEKRGWDLDPVGDLARLMRLPGTSNVKDGCPAVDVKLVYADGDRYTPVDILKKCDELMPLDEVVATPTASKSDDLILNADAEPPKEKFASLMQNPKASATWDGTRTDMLDDSQSSTDMSLASLAARAGWVDQEIADLLIASRRHNNKPPKLRVDYLSNTISKARSGTDNVANEAVDEDWCDVIKEQGLEATLATVIEGNHSFAFDGSGEAHIWTDGRYTSAESFLRGFARSQLEDWNATKHWSNNVYKHLGEYLRAQAPLLWEQPPTTVLNLQNGLLDVSTRELQLHTPSHLSTVQLPVSFDPAATCPRWDAFIEQAFPEDARHVAYELIAFAMLPDPSIQKAILLVGAGGNGKSVFLRALQALLGRENYSTLALQRIESERFSSSRLLGKLANICADLPATDLVGSSVFKGITGGDTITAERKFKDSFDFRPSVRLIFSANVPPRTPDAGDAFFDRWVVVPFDRTFRGEVNERPSQMLDAELSAPEEMSGVLNKALAALADLKARGGISEPFSLVKAKQDFRATTDPLSVWLDQELMSVPNGYIPKAQLRDAYNKYAGETGRPNMSANAFGRQLNRARPDLRTVQRTVNGRKVDVVPGFTFRIESMLEEARGW